MYKIFKIINFLGFCVFPVNYIMSRAIDCLEDYLFDYDPLPWGFKLN